jgi:hypothetical protein
MNFELHEVQVLYLLSEQQLESQWKLFFVELVTTVYMSYKYPAYNVLFVSRGTNVYIVTFCVIFVVCYLFPCVKGKH